ncbi:MAG: HD domain-containing protein [Desulfobacteraceae bacterium]|nr:HD domain-containing protein [Desulfobacteraceae bacterium]
MIFNNIDIFGNPSHMVMDPVHGGIEFFSHERAIIDHPNFQRLRHIKQNDVLHLVFPGANHSRFEHSIGTMHVAGRIFKSMLRNYFTEKKLEEKIVLNEDITASIQYCYACLRAAALLHDTGHFPFSHQFEASPFGKSILHDKDVTTNLQSRFGHLFETSCEEVSHEHMSIVSANCILASIPDLPIDPTDVISIMEHGAIVPSDQFISCAREVLGIFIDRVLLDKFPKKQIAKKVIKLLKDVISGEIDADKMDYLLRDSYYTGCNYGLYNIDHIIRNIFAGYDTITNAADPWIGIAIHKKGIGGLEDFVYSRFRMYLQVYNHKTVIGLKWILQQAVSEVANTDLHQLVKESIADPTVFKHLTDDFFLERFRQHANANAKSACRALTDRKVLPFLRSVKTPDSHVKERFKRELMQDNPGMNIIYYESASKFSKIKPKYDRIRILSINKALQKRQLESIAENSNFFEKFDDITEVHYYNAPNYC